MPSGTSAIMVSNTPSGVGSGPQSTKQTKNSNLFSIVMQNVAQPKQSITAIQGKLNDQGLTFNKEDPASKLMSLLDQLETMLKNQKDPKVNKETLNQLSALQKLLGQIMADSSLSQGKILKGSQGKTNGGSDQKQKIDVASLLQNADQYEATIMPLIQLLINTISHSKNSEIQGQLTSGSQALTELNKILGTAIQELQKFKTELSGTPSSMSTKSQLNTQGENKAVSPTGIKSAPVMVKSANPITNSLSVQHGKTAASEMTNNNKGSVKTDSQMFSFQSGPMNKLQQLTFHQPKPPVPVPVNQQIIQQISDYLGKNGIQTLRNGAQQMTVTLHPASLGEVTITLTQDPNGIIAKIVTAEAGTKDLIQSQLQQLNQGLQAQQIPVHKIEVGQNTVFNSQAQQQPFQQSQHQDNHEQQPEHPYIEHAEDVLDDTGQTFEEWLKGGTINEY